MYGLYSNTIERFLVIDDDKHVLYTVAILLTSKIHCNVVKFDESKINNHNCSEWTLINPTKLSQDLPYPRVINNFQDSCKLVGAQTNTPSNIFTNHLMHIQFVYIIVKSIIWVELSQPASFDHTFDFINDDLVKFHADPDFMKKELFKSVYESSNIDELYQKIKLLSLSWSEGLRKKQFIRNVNKNAEQIFTNTLYSL